LRRDVVCTIINLQTVSGEEYMRWRDLRRSENIEDRRADGGGFGFPFPSGGGRFPVGG
jgi:hypothetical protein